MLHALQTTEITLIADPRVLAIPIVENHNPMIDIKDQTALAFGPSPEIENNTDYTKMRQTVYEKLLEAQALLPQGIRFCIYEAYRSLALQEYLFQFNYEHIKKAHLSWSHEDIFIETTRLVSPVINLDGTRNVPPHSTGAAVDLYLIDEHGNPLDMGLHPANWMSDPDGVLSQTDCKTISLEAQKNRHIMNQALLKVGFANYPTEFWHWSYGDRYWAFQTGATAAIYGSIQ